MRTVIIVLISLICLEDYHRITQVKFTDKDTIVVGSFKTDATSGQYDTSIVNTKATVRDVLPRFANGKKTDTTSQWKTTIVQNKVDTTKYSISRELVGYEVDSLFNTILGPKIVRIYLDKNKKRLKDAYKNPNP